MAVTIEIVCNTDSLYTPHLGVLLKSISRSNRNNKIHVHVIGDELSERIKQEVASCVPALQISWYEAKDHKVLLFKPFLQISRAAYLRLTMAEILPISIRKVIYLDADIIVNADLMPLWISDLQDNICGAVIDPGISSMEFSSCHGLEKGNYFNSGVMLIDLEKARASSIFETAIRILEVPDEKLEYADQDALNIVMWNRWLALDPGWNFQRKFLYDNCAAWKALCPAKTPAPQIIHYTERFKPWQKEEWHPYAWLYLRTLLTTPFSSRILKAGKIGFVDLCRAWIRYKIRRPAIFRKVAQ